MTGTARCLGPLRRPHIQLQAVFAVGQLLVVVLIAHRPKGGRITDTGPGFRRKRLPPAQFADGRLCERNVLENRHPIGSQAAAKLAGADRNDWIGSRGLCRRCAEIAGIKACPKQRIQVRVPEFFMDFIGLPSFLIT